MKIACLIATWRGGNLLAEAVASAAPHVDVVIVLDGAYAGVVGDQPSWSSIDELEPAADAGDNVVLMAGAGHEWPDEIAKRNVLLELGRAFLPADDADRWALVLDEDELLINGERLRAYVEREKMEMAPGLIRVEPDGAAWQAPSRLFRLLPATRYAIRSYWLINPATVLEHWRFDDFDDVDRADVYVQHRWDQREPWRQEIQQRYGRILAERDHGPS